MGTLGENLKEIREDADLSIEKLSEITKIQEKYLKRLENEEFDKLPNPVYIRGFIKKWAKACNADEKELVLQFYRENEEFSGAVKKDEMTSLKKPSFFITSKHIIITVLILALIALASFFYFNQRLVSEVPQIEIVYPAEFNSVTEEDEILIRGEVENTEIVLINNNEITPDSGIFEYTFQLSAGLNNIIISARSPEGKEIETARKVLKL